EHEPKRSEYFRRCTLGQGHVRPLSVRVNTRAQRGPATTATPPRETGSSGGHGFQTAAHPLTMVWSTVGSVTVGGWACGGAVKSNISHGARAFASRAERAPMVKR